MWQKDARHDVPYCLFTPTRKAVIKRNNAIYVEDVRTLGPSYTEGDKKVLQPFWNILWQVLTRLNTELAHDLVILFLGIF